MLRIYANLLGEWTDITDDGTVNDHRDPKLYFKEDGLDYKEGSDVPECFRFNYINVQFDGKNYRLDPSHIQFVTVS